MSWQTYVDDYLMAQENGTGLTHSAIFGLDGISWAKSADFPELTDDQKVAVLKEFGDPGGLACNGLLLGETKYFVIQGDPGQVIRGKKGSSGVTIKKTKRAIIFGMYQEPMQPSQGSLIVERIGDYLKDQDF